MPSLRFTPCNASCSGLLLVLVQLLPLDSSVFSMNEHELVESYDEKYRQLDFFNDRSWLYQPYIAQGKLAAMNDCA